MSEKIDLSTFVLNEDEEFMNASQRAYFRAKLNAWKNDILREARETLDHLSMPYIEVHDDSAQVLETYLDLRHAPLATVVFNRDRPGGHALALSIALRRLAMPASGV